MGREDWSSEPGTKSVCDFGGPLGADFLHKSANLGRSKLLSSLEQLQDEAGPTIFYFVLL
jgi:hypothetical protein